MRNGQIRNTQYLIRFRVIPTVDTTTASSHEDQHQNTSQSDHQFKRPEVHPLRRYRHPTAGLNRNDNYNFIDLRGDYVWADEAI